MSAIFRWSQGQVRLYKMFGFCLSANFSLISCFKICPCRGELEEYMDLLVRNFNPNTVDSLMCRDHVSVGWDGRLYDCDFNQQLEIGFLEAPGKPDSKRRSVFDVESLDVLTGNRSNTDNHCFGCTAGMGSS